MLKHFITNMFSHLIIVRNNPIMKGIKKLQNKNFIRNVFTVATGTVVAQVITMGFSPIITRIYGPEIFGVLGVFQSIVAILTPIAALTYPIAIVLPKEDLEAKGLMRLSFFIAIIMSIIIGLSIALFGPNIIELFQIEVLGSYLFIIPLVMFFSAVLQILNQWVIRKKLYNLKAKVAVTQSLLINSSKSGIGLFYPTSLTLILITSLGDALHSVMLAIGVVKKSFNEKVQGKLHYSVRDILGLFKKYQDFPKYRAPEVFSNAISQSLPILLLTTFFGPAVAGFYTIGKSVLSVPSQLIGSAIGDVFYPRISEASNKNESVCKLLTKATLIMAIVGFIPFSIIIFFGPSLFSVIFGTEWSTAGEYARWMALWSFFAFINIPSIKTLPVLSAQRFLLSFSLTAIIVRLVALIIGSYLFNSDVIAIMLFSVSGAILNIILILGTIAKSKLFDNRNDFYK